MSLRKIHHRALAGDLTAQAELGYRYAKGKGVRRSYRRAVHWDRLAAEAGHPAAQYNLAEAYFTGRGVAKNVRRALELYKRVWSNRAADVRLRAEAALNLGWAFKNSMGPRPDLGSARSWYRRAAHLGSASAFYNLGLMNLEREKTEAAARYFRLGAALQHPESMYELARLHLDHALTSSDSALAKELLRAAARRSPRAKRLLKSKMVATTAPGSPRHAVAATPDASLEGRWALMDSDAWLQIRVARRTEVDCRDDEESLVVSCVRWEDGDLLFSTLCRSTGWHVENRLMLIDHAALLVIRRGDADAPTTALRARGTPRVVGRGPIAKAS